VIVVDTVEQLIWQDTDAKWLRGPTRVASLATGFLVGV